MHSLYAWVKRYTKPQEQRVQVGDQSVEFRRLRAELKRVTEGRDIFKKAVAYDPKTRLPLYEVEVMAVDAHARHQIVIDSELIGHVDNYTIIWKIINTST
jgi:hypothetical protein